MVSCVLIFLHPVTKMKPYNTRKAATYQELSAFLTVEKVTVTEVTVTFFPDFLRGYSTGSVVDPMRKVSMWWAARRPSAIAQTIRDWPRRMSPAAKTPLDEVI